MGKVSPVDLFGTIYTENARTISFDINQTDYNDWNLGANEVEDSFNVVYVLLNTLYDQYKKIPEVEKPSNWGMTKNAPQGLAPDEVRVTLTVNFTVKVLPELLEPKPDPG